MKRAVIKPRRARTRRMAPVRPPARAISGVAQEFARAVALWQQRRARLGDGAVGRKGDNHIEQGTQIAYVLADVLGQTYYEHGLDFGCGWGRFMPIIAARCGHIWAVDVFQDWLDRAVADVPHATGTLLTEPSLPLDDGSMTLIVDIMTLQSIDTAALRARYVSELLRVAAPGAQLISLHKCDSWLETQQIFHGLDGVYTKYVAVDSEPAGYYLLTARTASA